MSSRRGSAPRSARDGRGEPSSGAQRAGMLDLSNGCTFTLGTAEARDTGLAVVPLLVPGEAVVASFAGAHDGVVLTDERLVAVTVHGLTGTGSADVRGWAG